MAQELTRRGFLKRASLIAGGAAMVGLVSCAPGSGPSAASQDMPESAEAVGDAEPIAPLEVPSAWDEEFDVVVVGSGGGLNATMYAAENGASVVCVEKEGRIGGASRHASAILITAGGTKQQEEAGYGWPVAPFNLDAAVAAMQKEHNFSLDDKLQKAFLTAGAEMVDWLLGHENIDLTYSAPYTTEDPKDQTFNGCCYFPTAMLTGEHSGIQGMELILEPLAEDAEKAGATILTSTECTGLVYDGERVAGIRVVGEDGSEKYFKANKGVILTAGGFGMNLDMLQKWIPSAYYGAVQGGPMPFHTGEVTRMAQGLGADMAGFNSYSCWPLGMDEYWGDGDGSYWHYFWGGERQLVSNAWLRINKMGNRMPYLVRCPGWNPQPAFSEFGFDCGDVATASVWASQPGGKSYVIFDDDYRTNVFKLFETYGPPFEADPNRKPLTEEDILPDDALISNDWVSEVQAAIDRGAIKKADTLEELAEMMGFAPEVLVSAVDRWNELCEQGEDTDLSIPYLPEWLLPIKKPPYYGSCVGGMLGKTLCGVRVNENMQVVNTDGGVIPGLYAGYTTAGGFAGESCFGGRFGNPTALGSVGVSLATGYWAAKSLLSE